MGSERRGPKRSCPAAASTEPACSDHASQLPARGRRAGAGNLAPYRPDTPSGPGGGACSPPPPPSPPRPPTAAEARKGPVASVSAGDARRAELRPEDATRAQFRRGGRASDSDGGGVGAPSCGEAAGAPGREPGPEEGELVRSAERGGRWARRGPVTVAGPGAVPSRPAEAAGARTRSQAPPGCGLGRRVRGHGPLPARGRGAGGARWARGLGGPGTGAPAGSRRPGRAPCGRGGSAGPPEPLPRRPGPDVSRGASPLELILSLRNAPACIVSSDVRSGGGRSRFCLCSDGV